MKLSVMTVQTSSVEVYIYKLACTARTVRCRTEDPPTRMKREPCLS